MSLDTGAKSAAGMLASWLVAGAILVVTFWFYDDIRPHIASAFGISVTDFRSEQTPKDLHDGAAKGGGSVELRAGSDGHFQTTAYVNGRPVNVLVDTGATLVSLSFEDAERAGIFLSESDFTHRALTANGYTKVAPVTINRIEIQDIVVRNIRGSVHQAGGLQQSLLGMSFLQRLGRAEIRKGSLILEQ